ncbi:2-oxoglutarate dehydrogenase E1 component [Heyndrickxia ginsengihumi]|uniref:2-oxoglutarate dehydrogenase E1 component n=1 Tax=Heyndrickxia ginsengihumi TaxID=363870 RepID=A0A0A6V850_9BACI|nr:2-oxoglutarate dehydrogenase E1 component [Heyndrickxia ginsengihumi]KHD84240.1 2-oxoglutarate dehydrogenase [Heyndrickxia ginsengihumi]MBE6185091.1 2-oxoglutarate dehydrogenase E1 component [Bacillus sp. (in: firmicutes)]MCM3023683.1 2-oxoglutarate dehydrogenase E1 component [Heyndrickxia ginsengihumi]NEY19847.1 2-oxoglutarate dehydrogenase E1 component [Heyndrickxia ginsengihumi]
MTEQTPKGFWESFSGPNLGYVMEMYEQYLENPDSVAEEMKELFIQWGAPILPETGKTTHGQADISFQLPTNPNLFSKIVAAVKLADNIRTFGHLAADINPLHEANKEIRQMQLNEFDLTVEDLKSVPASFICPDAPSKVKNGYDAIEYLKEVYTKKVAFEFDHIHDLEEKHWIQRKIESGEFYVELTAEQKKNILRRLTQVEGFEKFIHRTFVGQKRFSIEGLDALVPTLEQMIIASVKSGVKTVNIGMAHRGRLNVLAHILEKPYELIFAEFKHASSADLIPSEGSIGITYGWTGDVKYHLGADRKEKNGSPMSARIVLANNPSHLEVANPVVEGYTRAAQDDRSTSGYPAHDPSRSFAILVHGDAAFAGQGIVAETLNMSRLNGYETGGTIHIIANNNIGFTTETYDSRSTKYASDPAKGYEVPVIHVNADDPEACVQTALFAYEYREKFKKDIVIDLVGYRRFGHNEMDEPMTTNPMMYKLVHQHPTVRVIYGEKLANEGLLPQEEVQNLDKEVQNQLQAAYDKVPSAEEHPDTKMTPPEIVVKGFERYQTAVAENELKLLNSELLQWPNEFHVFKKLERILRRRERVFDGEGKIDWAHAEALAFASILKDGTPIRFTGQDTQRGTFAQRNLVLHDDQTGAEYIPHHHLSDVHASFAIYNSPLTEAGVVGYEYGYNVFSPETLVIWEAQFGDFANMAQVMFDQFISSGRAKWGQKSGLVMLLPHGYEGQGPEHSSARMERFLQLAAENNWTVANLSTAGQYFHILRRQAQFLSKEEVRPLVLMTPKSLLRHPLASVDASALTNGKFNTVLEQPGLGEQQDRVERIILCSGKVAIDLEEKLKEYNDLSWLHILRLEQVYPFPEEKVQAIFARYSNLKEIVWLQEEPKNMASWTFVAPYLRKLAPKGAEVKYVGRPRRSSPSEGDPVVHKFEQNRILTEALVQTILKM